RGEGGGRGGRPPPRLRQHRGVAAVRVGPRRGEEGDDREVLRALELRRDGGHREAARRVGVAKAHDVEEQLLLTRRLHDLVVLQAVLLQRLRTDRGAAGEHRADEGRERCLLAHCVRHGSPVREPARGLRYSRASILRRRSATTLMICSAKCGVCCTMNMKRFSGIGTRVQSVLAVAVALRGACSISAISPSTPPGPSVSTSWPFTRNATSPSRTTYIKSPGSPSWKMSCPALKVASSVSSAWNRSTVAMGAGVVTRRLSRAHCGFVTPCQRG